jgi:hypothetical protein
VGEGETLADFKEKGAEEGMHSVQHDAHGERDVGEDPGVDKRNDVDEGGAINGAVLGERCWCVSGESKGERLLPSKEQV